MSKYRSQKTIQRKRKAIQILSLMFFSFLLFLVGLFSLLSKLDNLAINKINISGNKIINSKSIQNEVQKNISGNYFYLFSKDNFLIYPKKTIESGLFAKFPRIEKMKITLDFPDTLNIKIEEKKQDILWCQSEGESEKCFFADDSGFIFDKATSFSEGSFFKYYTKISSPNNPLGKVIFEKDVFDGINSFIKVIDGEGLDPHKLVEKEDGVYEIYFGDNNSRLIFKSSQDIKEVMNNFQSVLNMEDFVDREAVKSLEYVDLRYGNKVFYK